MCVHHKSLDLAMMYGKSMRLEAIADARPVSSSSEFKKTPWVLSA